MSKTLHKTCEEAGWHRSRYLIYAKLPDEDGYVVLDIYRGSLAVLTSVELYLLSIVETLDLAHPALEKFRKYGLIVNFDQAAALEASGRSCCGLSSAVNLTICPTIGCNFDCPYCFEDHRSGKMSPEVQDQVVLLAEKMLQSFGARELNITWFGGEPLLASDVIESLSVRLMELSERKSVKYNAGIVTNGYLLDERNAELLGRCRIDQAQITLDGVEEVHDRTRHLAGGGKTFAHICKNLRCNKLPFKVLIRHNVYEDNLDQVEPLRTFVKQLAQESGNDIQYYPALVCSNAKLEKRDKTLDPLQKEQSIMDLELELEAGRYRAKGGIYCGANILSCVSTDDAGRLYKCWSDVDKPERSFGTAASWNPDMPIFSAESPDALASYLNTCCPTPDPECRECLWLPMCGGGCPSKRFEGDRVCFSFKDDPGAFALAVYNRRKKQRS